ncbi:fibronectin type III domain-containing protein [Arthrobacter sp. BB-1]|uniref:fibronectin type III domain-containing protein n=1 Tax=unclassified Arthrobacter TaxID=235627 RepID=UPI00111206DE|nr:MULTISPECIES: fibronectin type III domain-containing protein [unclassified Arthrobacter]TNB74186.1 fibronectin type III domain-containing protein [Arthrobacter sp. BB-1]
MITCLAVAAAFLLVSTPPALAATPPTAPPTNFTATRIFTDANELTWTDASTNEKYFEIETKDGFNKPWVKTWTTFDPAAPPTGKRYSQMIKGLPENRVFCYRVSAVNDAGRQTTGEKCAAPALPAKPFNMTIDRIWDSSIEFKFETASSWTWSYKVYTKRAGDAPWVLNREVPAQIYDGRMFTYARDLLPERYYCVRVAASNSKGESEPSNEACGTTKIRRPAAPTDLKARSDSPTTVTLTWTDISTTETAYELARGDDTTIRSWGPLSGIYTTTISGLTPATDYYYYLRVKNDGGTSYTEQVRVTTQSAPPPPTEVTQSYFVQPTYFPDAPVHWRIYLNPNLPAGAYVKSFQYVVGPDWIMHVMKPGKLYSQCGSPDASVPLDGYQLATADQLNVLYGSSQPKLPLWIEACASSRSGNAGNITIGQILMNVIYVIP